MNWLLGKNFLPLRSTKLQLPPEPPVEDGFLRLGSNLNTSPPFNIEELKTNEIAIKINKICIIMQIISLKFNTIGILSPL